jgi:ABC-2 type transport system ATP-binding protein
MIELDHLTKTYHGRRAVDDVSLTIGAGEIVGLLGPNGAGKSTLLGMLLGLLRPDAGEARIHGVSVQRDRARALRGVGGAFGAAAFHPHLSGWQNLARLASWSGGAPCAEIERAVDFVGLADRIHERTRAYSRGMLLRLTLAQALVPQPGAIVLDEPLEGLDPAGVCATRTLLGRIRDEWRASVVLSSHLLGEVEAICDRVAILHEGRLTFAGSVREATTPPERRWRLDVDDWARAAAALAPHRVRVPEPGVVALGPDDDLGPVVATLVRAGVRVHDVVPLRAELEARYLAAIAPR